MRVLRLRATAPRAIMRVAIKFCGLTRRADVAAASELGAAYAGVIFAGGPRMQSIDSAASLLDESDSARSVGVFRAGARDDMRRALDALPLRAVQLHGDVSEADVAAARDTAAEEVWAVARVGATGLPDGIETLFRAADAVVLDTASATGLGGTGTRFDWEQVATQLDALPHRARRARLVLAGGLRPDNVVAAIRALAPDVVDVSSGVECAPGIKDVELMRRFVDAVGSV